MSMQINKKYYIIILDSSTFKPLKKSFTDKILFSERTMNNILLLISPKKSLLLSKDNKFFKMLFDKSNNFPEEDVNLYCSINDNFNKHDDGTFKIIFKCNISYQDLCFSIDEIMNYSNEGKIMLTALTLINSIDFYINNNLFSIITDFPLMS